MDDPRLLAWFGQNSDIFFHEKFYPIPIGIANKKWSHGNQKVFNEVLSQLEKNKATKLFKIYMNFSQRTTPKRRKIFQYFKNKPFVITASQKSIKQYLHEMARYKFVLSSHGNGLYCHRT